MVVAEEEDAPPKQQTVSRSHTFLSFLRAWQNICRIINTITYFMPKYAHIFFHGCYLFIEAHSFAQASVLENCSYLGNDNDRCRNQSPA